MRVSRSKIKKAISRFARGSEDISRILETNFSQGLPNHLPFWEGVHTIRNLNVLDDFNPKRPKIFELREDNITKGYVEADNAKAIHLLGHKRKLVKPIMASYYHAIADDLAEIVYGIEKYPDAELVIDVSQVAANLGEESWDFLRFFLKCLDDQKIKYTLVDLSKFDIIYINNFTLLSFPFHSGARLDMLAEFFSQYVTNKKQVAHRKVFVSRGKLPWRDDSDSTETFSFKHDNRIDDHSKIEKVFQDLGFEIVYPEDFRNFQEQLDFFYSVKTLASLTSSGIVNAVFMQPGGTIVELVTPLITKSPIISNEYLRKHKINPSEYDVDVNTVQEIHMFYHNLAFLMEHLYVGIPNYYRDSDRIRLFIDDNAALKEMLER